MRRLTDQPTEPMFSSSESARVDAAAGSTSWGAPVPFDTHDGLHPFPLDALPSWLAAYVEALSTSIQTPADLPAMLGLAAVATATAKTAGVHLREDHSEPLNIFVVVALPPASRKSAVFKAINAPLSEYERQEIERLAPIRELAITKQKHAERNLDRAIGSETEEEIQRLLAEKNAIEVPTEPRLITEDCTPEKLSTLLVEQEGRMAVLSPEGGGVFDLMAGRYSEGASNLDVYLKGHAGDDLRVDRVKRAPEFVSSPALTLGLAIQPAVLQAFRDRPGFRGRGLLARFLYAVPPNTIGSRKADSPPVPRPTKETYERNMRLLLAWRTAGCEAEQAIRLSPEARAAWIQFSDQLEPRLGPGGDLEHVADWAGKLPGAVGRIAGLLHLATLLPTGGESQQAEMAMATMEKAIRIGRYLTAHALAAFDVMGADPVIEGAKAILAWIKRTGLARFSTRDLHQALRARFKRANDLTEPLKVLAERFYVRPVESSPKGGPGRPASRLYEVNPWLSESSQSSKRERGRGSEDSEGFERGEA